MIEIKHECPECSKISVLGYGFEDLEKCLGTVHGEAECADCKHVGMNLRFEIDGFGKKTFFIPSDAKVLSINFPEFFFQEDYEGQLLGSVVAEKEMEGSEPGVITFLAVGKRVGGRTRGRVLRTRDTVSVDELTFQDEQIERLGKLRPLEYVHKVCCVESDRPPLDSVSANSSDSKQSDLVNSELSLKDLVFVVTAKNGFTRNPMFLAESSKGSLGVTDAIRSACVYENIKVAEKAVEKAKEEFGKAYTSYSAEPLSRSLINSIVVRSRNRRR